MELAVKIQGISYGNRAAVLDEVQRHRELHAQLLAYYLKDAERWYPEPTAVAEADLPAWLVLQGGIGHERFLVDWCTQVLTTLGELR